MRAGSCRIDNLVRVERFPPFPGFRGFVFPFFLFSILFPFPLFAFFLAFFFFLLVLPLTRYGGGGLCDGLETKRSGQLPHANAKIAFSSSFVLFFAPDARQDLQRCPAMRPLSGIVTLPTPASSASDRWDTHTATQLRGRYGHGTQQ